MRKDSRTDAREDILMSSEFRGIQFQDERLSRRFVRVMESLAQAPTAPINQACSSWAETKAAYRLMDNEKVSVEEISRCHREQTLARIQGEEAVVVIQDTSFINYDKHRAVTGLGSIGKNQGKSSRASQGLVMHTALAITEGGTPLGILDQQIWSRSKSKFNEEHSEANKWFVSLQRTVEVGSRVGKRLITIADREADITNLMAHCRQNDTDFIFRVKAGRSVQTANNPYLNLENAAEREESRGTIEVEINDRLQLLGERWRDHRKPAEKRTALVDVFFREVTLKSSPQFKGHLARSPSDEDLTCFMVVLKERNPLPKRKEIGWYLLTSLPVKTFAEAKRVAELYQLRWGIENFHKVLKSGCTIEDCRLETSERLIRYLTLMSIVAWRLYRLTRIGRETPQVPCTVILSESEWKALYLKIHKTKADRKLPHSPPTLYEAIRWIGRLGGYLDRNTDPPPGITVMWRGWERLQGLAEGYELFAS